MPQPGPELESLVAMARSGARQQYARWDDALFDRYKEDTIAPLWMRLKERSPELRPQSMRTYLDLVAAGIGAGYLASTDGAPHSLMEAFVRDLIPWWFSESARDRHGRIAASAWNLAEGARRQALWIEQYLLACIDEFDNPMRLKETAATLLAPVIEPRPNATWLGPFAVAIIDFREVDKDFLPGTIHAISPTLVSVEDRRKSVRHGVLLLPRGESRYVGVLPVAMPTTVMPDATTEVSIAWGDEHIDVGETRIELPLMGMLPRHAFIARCGFVLATLNNSQRIWVIDTP